MFWMSNFHRFLVRRSGETSGGPGWWAKRGPRPGLRFFPPFSVLLLLKLRQFWPRLGLFWEVVLFKPTSYLCGRARRAGKTYSTK